MTPQQKYYLKNKDDDYFKECHYISQAKYRANHRESYNKYMREWMKKQKLQIKAV